MFTRIQCSEARLGDSCEDNGLSQYTAESAVLSLCAVSVSCQSDVHVIQVFVALAVSWPCCRKRCVSLSLVMLCS